MDDDGILVRESLESKIGGSILTNMWCVRVFGGFYFLYDLGVMSEHETVRAVRTCVRKLSTTSGRCASGGLNGDGQSYVRSAVG